MEISAEGILAGAPYLASPNSDLRPDGAGIELIVVHNISLPPGQFAGNGVVDLFTNRLQSDAHPYYAGIAKLRVSAHFFVRRSGLLLQFVPCAMRAWHAGESSWRGRSRCNDFSIGIELEGTDDQAYTEPQYDALIRLTEALQRRYASITAIAGHQDIAPNRKSDPGPCFDWQRCQSALAGQLAWRV